MCKVGFDGRCASMLAAAPRIDLAPLRLSSHPVVGVLARSRSAVQNLVRPSSDATALRGSRAPKSIRRFASKSRVSRSSRLISVEAVNVEFAERVAKARKQANTKVCLQWPLAKTDLRWRRLPNDAEVPALEQLVAVAGRTIAAASLGSVGGGRYVV